LARWRRPSEGTAVPASGDVDRWFAEKKHPLEASMQRVREIILAADPRVMESVKWSTPTFSYEGNIASFMPSTRFVSLMFHRGSEIPGTHPRLEGDNALARTMRFADAAEVEKARRELTAVIRAWCKAKGPA